MIDEFGATIRVLHVDDDEEIRELTAAFLRQETDRLAVETATSAADALERLDDRVDCVVAGYELPDRDGIELLEAVRERYPDLPFVLYTGKGSEEIASEAISAGVTDYLQKDPGTGQYAVLANRIENAVDAYRSERLLERRSRRLERLIGNLPGMVYRCRNEPGWPMETVEGEVEALSGYDGDAIERGDVSWGDDVIHPEDRGDVWDRVQRSIDDGGTFEVSYRIRTADGETRRVWERGRGVDDDDGELVAIEGFITDVTERERREERLSETTARLEALFEQSPDMINVHDGEGTIAEPNARLCEKTGYSEAELVGMKVWEIDRSIDPESAKEIWASVEPGRSHRLESEYERADGSTFPVEVHTRRLDGEEDDSFVVISRDISERRERERDLERFASVLSHDLRNPLNVAQGHLELAAGECDSDHLDRVADAHGRMNDLIDSLLDLARGGQTDLAPVDLAAVVGVAWDNVDTDGATLSSSVTATVRADRSRLTQLFENLFRNGVEHAGPGCTVTVGALDGGFFVADDGPGIPDDEREAVFETGYSGDGGTGFGLSIVERVAEAHDWSVDLVVSADGGARFEFTGVELA